MKIASYNVENMFLRARALNQSTWAEGNVILKAHADLNRVLGKQAYSTAARTKIVSLMGALGLARSDDGKFALLRQNKGHLVKRPQAGGLEVVAGGRADWIGWVELQVEQVDEVATRNTARVINDVNADVLGVVEAESRPALMRFSEDLLPAVNNGTPYGHVMLIDGNDERGIDVGVMTRAGYEILEMRSHVDDKDATGRIFSRDCAEYVIRTPKGNTVVGRAPPSSPSTSAPTGPPPGADVPAPGARSRPTG